MPGNNPRRPDVRVVEPRTGLPRTGMVMENPNGTGVIIRNSHTPELEEAFRRQLPLDFDRDDRRTLAQIATTAFAAYNDYNFHRGEEQFNNLVAVARANNEFAERIGRQYDRIQRLGGNLPFLEEPVPGGRPVRMTRDRFIDIVGATTLLTTLIHGNGAATDAERGHHERLLQTAITDPRRRAGAMAELDREWSETFVNTDVNVIDNPHEYIAALCAKAIGPTNFRRNYNEILEAAMGNRDLRVNNLAIATETPLIDERPVANPNTNRPESRPNSKKLEKKLGGLIYESKARKEENNVVIKAMILAGETFTDVALAYANLRMFSHLNKIAQHLNNTLMDQDKKGVMHVVSNLTRKATIMGAVYTYCDTKFQAEREGIRNNRANGLKMMGTLAVSNIALDIVESHFIKKGLALEELFTIPVAPYFYNLRPDLKGWRSIGKLFTIAEGTHRLGLVNGLHKVQQISPNEANKRTWKDIQKGAGTVRDLLDRFDDSFTVWSIGSAVIEHLIPDQVKTNWFAGRALRLVDNAFNKWAENAEDISDLSEIPEVMAGLVESYAELVTESFNGGTGLTGTQSQIITEVIRRYIENNDADNDYVTKVANRFLRKLGLPEINPQPQVNVPPGRPQTNPVTGQPNATNTGNVPADTQVNTQPNNGNTANSIPENLRQIAETIKEFAQIARIRTKAELRSNFPGVPDAVIDFVANGIGLT